MAHQGVNLTHGMILLFLLLHLRLVNSLNTTCHAGKEIRNDFDWKFSRELTCGDFCVNKTRSDIACLCGQDKLDSENWWNNEFLAIYCCNSGPCYQESIGTNTVIKCPNAKLTNVTEKCGEECPAVAQSGSALGISVNCQKPDKCLEEFHYVVKACYNTTKDYPPKKFSRLFCPYPYGRHCPEIKESKYKYHECYDIMNWPGQYRCLNRGDLQEQAFQKRLGSTTHQGFPRTNANMLISSTNETHFTCGGENQTYRWDTACDHKGFGDRDGEKFCSFPNGAAIRLGRYRNDRALCEDASFWSHKCPDKTGCSINQYYGIGNATSCPKTDFFCQKSQTCIPGNWTCDGLVNCYYGEDENFSLCKTKFSETASVECFETARDGYKIRIFATPCDGIVECQNGIDEKDCSVPVPIKVFPGLIIYIMVHLSWLYTFWLVKKYKKSHPQSDLDLQAPEILLKGEQLAKAKNDFEPTICKDYIEANASKQEKILDFFDKLALPFTTIGKVCTDVMKKPKVEFILGPIFIMSAYLDMIKDSVLLYYLAKLSGGFRSVVNNFHKFPSVVVLMLFSSIVLPSLFGGIRLAIRAPEVIIGTSYMDATRLKKFMYQGIVIFFYPFLSGWLYLRKAYIDNLISWTPTKKSLVILRDKICFELKQFVKLELGLETIFQLFGQFLLLFNAATATRTGDCFNQIFDESTTVDATFFLVLSIMWSLKSCVLSHLKGVSTKREHFPAMSMMMAGLTALCSSAIRIMSFIMFFTPALGLFSLLRHLQAEQTAYFPLLPNQLLSLRNDGYVQFGNAPAFLWSTIDRWQDGKMPDYTFYSLFSLKQYFLGFWVLLSLQIAIMFMVKIAYSEAFHNLNFLEKIIHATECSHIPYNCEEWDTEKGNAKAHAQRMEMNRKEGLAMICLNFVFNAIFLSPLCILCHTISQRHHDLLETIGALEQESIAYAKIWQILIGSYVFLVLGTIFETISFLFYNERYHPFANILKPSKVEEYEMTQLLKRQSQQQRESQTKS